MVNVKKDKKIFFKILAVTILSIFGVILNVGITILIAVSINNLLVLQSIPFSYLLTCASVIQLTVIVSLYFTFYLFEKAKNILTTEREKNA